MRGIYISLCGNDTLVAKRRLFPVVRSKTNPSKIPYFINNNFLDNGYISEKARDISGKYLEEINKKVDNTKSNFKKRLGRDALEQSYFSEKQSEIISELNKNFNEYFEKFFTSISNLLSLFNNTEETEDSQKAIHNL